MGKHGGVGFAVHPVPAPDELTAQLAVVVNFAVENHLDIPGLVANRLAAVEDARDREPGMTEKNARRYEDPIIVGPAVFEQGDRGTGRVRVGSHLRTGQRLADDSAHGKY